MARLSPRSIRPNALVDSFLGLLDIKSGAEIILLFGLVNKVAGVYGLISLFTGGDFYQLSFYFYSTVTLIIFVWGMRAVSQESSSKVLTLAHLYAIDHILQTLYTAHFALEYINAPHDGRRVINSQAQKDLIDLAISRGEISGEGDGEDAARLAQTLWKQERGTAGAVVVLAWLIKIYFIIVLYSYAAHLRKNTYHALPLSSSATNHGPHTPLERIPSATAADGESIEVVTDLSHSVRKGKNRAQELSDGDVEEEFRWDSDEEAQEAGPGKKKGARED